MHETNLESVSNIVSSIEESVEGFGGINQADYSILDNYFSSIVENEDWSKVVQLRELLNFAFTEQATGGLGFFRKLSDYAIIAVQKTVDRKKEARYRYDRGIILHQLGEHTKALLDFVEASAIFQNIGEWKSAIEAEFFKILCYRALGHPTKAKMLLDQLCNEIKYEDPWISNPLIVKSWLLRDEGDLLKAESNLRLAIQINLRNMTASNIQLSENYADLAEIYMLQGRNTRAAKMFTRSYRIAENYQGKFARVEAQILNKWAALDITNRDFSEAKRKLDIADDKIRVYGKYYEMQMRIEITRGIRYFAMGALIESMKKFRLANYFRMQTSFPLYSFLSRIFRGIILSKMISRNKG